MDLRRCGLPKVYIYERRYCETKNIGQSLLCFLADGASEKRRKVNLNLPAQDILLCYPKFHWSSKVRFCKFATDSDGRDTTWSQNFRCEGQRARAALVVCLFGAWNVSLCHITYLHVGKSWSGGPNNDRTGCVFFYTSCPAATFICICTFLHLNCLIRHASWIWNVLRYKIMLPVSTGW